VNFYRKLKRGRFRWMLSQLPPEKLAPLQSPKWKSNLIKSALFPTLLPLPTKTLCVLIPIGRALGTSFPDYDLSKFVHFRQPKLFTQTLKNNSSNLLSNNDASSVNTSHTAVDKSKVHYLFYASLLGVMPEHLHVQVAAA